MLAFQHVKAGQKEDHFQEEVPMKWEVGFQRRWQHAKEDPWKAGQKQLRWRHGWEDPWVEVE